MLPRPPTTNRVHSEGGCIAVAFQRRCLSLRTTQLYVKCTVLFYRKAAQLLDASRINNIENFGEIFSIMHDCRALSNALVDIIEVWWQDSD